MQSIAGELRVGGKRIGLVPTMGYLHEGHLSLLDEAQKQSDVVVMSIYVNPTQFGRGEDFERYPRDLERDEKMAAARGVEYLFEPVDREMYPEGFLTFVELDKVSHLFEGEFRPGHFRGVATIVTKLFNIIRPHVAVFGQKDAQQVFIIQKLVSDLDFNVRIRVAPIVRDPDGLAMSSRNVYLSESERAQASVIYRSLKLAERILKEGDTDLVHVRSEMIRLIDSVSDAKIDYVSFVNTSTFDRVESTDGLEKAQAILAVRFGKTRLIDNMLYDLGH